MVDSNASHAEGWRQFATRLLGLPSGGWVFRGLSDARYKNTSRLERSLRECSAPRGDWSLRERIALRFFMERARACLVSTPQDDDVLSWLSLMQHYGAPTRLTDWTMSPWVAVYFAFARPPIGATHVTLVLLNADRCRLPFGEKEPNGWDPVGTSRIMQPNRTHDDSPVRRSAVLEAEGNLLRRAISTELRWPLPLTIPSPDRRMIAQRACFVADGCLDGAVEQLFESGASLLAMEGTKIDPSGRYFSRGTSLPASTPTVDLVQKVELPISWRPEAMRTLAAMNITADSLFPGLDGLGAATDGLIQFGEPLSPSSLIGT